MNDRLQALMREATRLTRAGRLEDASAVIRQGLARGFPGASGRWPADDARGPADDIIDGLIVEVPETEVGADLRVDVRAGIGANAAAAGVPDPEPAARGAERFVAGTYRHGTLARDYKLYIPPSAVAGPAALVVMLHGCTQNPDDFAAGTAMNVHAREQGLFVLYPAQSPEANPSRCWNWFKHNHQQRDRGEPGLIASLARTLVDRHGIDPQRVYVAGLSAGGAMAAIVAAAHPDVFAAAGVHSGLPAGAANGVPEALAVMKRGRVDGGVPAAARAPSPARRVPVIVFHGDRDATVHPDNGSQVLADVTEAAGMRPPRVERGRSAGGRAYTRTVHADDGGRVVGEHWLVHGAGHAWSGGRPAGSYTDAAGPDATAEMLRFFREHGCPGGLPR